MAAGDIARAPYLPDDEADETAMERLLGLTEMFPAPIRDGCAKFVQFTGTGVKSAYSFGRTYGWIFFSSAAILLGPVIIQGGLQDFEEMAKMQQRQMLLGPAAAGIR